MTTMAAVDLGAQSGRVARRRGFDGERLEVDGGAPVPERAGAAPRHAALGRARPLPRACSTGSAPPAPTAERDRLDRRRLVGRRLRPPRPARPPRRRTRCTTATQRRAAAFEPALERVPARELYERTGIQLMPINTVFELAAMAAEGDPALDAAETLLMIPDLFTTGSPGRASASGRTRRRRSASTRAPARGRTTCSSRLDVPARLLPELVEPGTRLGAARGRRRRGDRPRHAGRRRGRHARHGLGRRGGAVPHARLGVHQRRHVVARRARGRRAADHGRDLRREPHERGRRRRHVPAAAQRHRALAPARVPPRAGRPRGATTPSTSSSRSPRAPSRSARSIDPERPVLRRARRHAGADPRRSAPRPASRSPTDPAAVTRCILESLALKHAEVVDLLASVTGAAPPELHIVGGGARNEPLCRWTAVGRGAARARRPGGGDAAREPARPGDRARRDRLARRGARGRAPRRSRRVVHEPEPSSAWQEARPRFARRSRRAEVAWHERGARRPARDPRARGPLGRRRAARASTRVDALAYRSNLLGADRALANIGGGNTSAKGIVRRPRRPRDARALGQGLRHRPRDDHARRLRRAAARRGAAAARRASRWTTRRWSTTSSAARSRPDQPRPSIETLLHAFVPRAAGRPHASRRGDRADLVARRAPARRGGVRRRGGLARLPAPRLRHVAPDRGAARREPGGAGRAAREARARDVGRDRRGELPRDDRVRLARRARDRPRRAAAGSASAARASPRPTTTTRSACSLAALPALRGALLEDAHGRDPRGRPQPRGGRVRLGGAHARGEPGRRAVPRPPDQHEAQAARRRLRSRARRRGRARARALRDGRRRVRGLVPRLLRAQPRRREPAVPDRSRRARASCSSRASGIVTSGGDAGRARVARDLYHRAVSVEDAADAIGGFQSLSEAEAFAIEYWPLERYKLAQAPPRGELAGRIALITGGASGIGRADRAPARRARRHVVVADLNADGARRGRRGDRRRRTARAARSPSRST